MSFLPAILATAGSGLLGSLLGGNQSQSTTMNMRKWTPEELQTLSQIFGQLPGAIKAAGPSAGDRGQKIGDEMYGVLSGDINKQFDRAGSKAKFRASLGGQGPSSILSAIVADLERSRGKSLAEAKTQASAAGSQIGIGERSSDLAALQTLFGSLNSMWGNRVAGSGQTTTMKGDPWGPAFGLGGMLAAMEYMK